MFYFYFFIFLCFELFVLFFCFFQVWEDGLLPPHLPPNLKLVWDAGKEGDNEGRHVDGVGYGEKIPTCGFFTSMN